MPDPIQQNALRDPIGQTLSVGDTVVWSKHSGGAGVQGSVRDGVWHTNYYRIAAVNLNVSIVQLDENMQPMEGRRYKSSVPPYAVIKIDAILRAQQ